MIDVPAEIDPTGTADVTADLLAFVATVPDGETVVFPEAGRYRCESTLKIVDRHGLTFELNGSEVFATLPEPPTGDPRNRSHWRLEGGSDLTFLDAKVKGAHPNGGTGETAWVPAYEAQHGFDVLGVDGLLIEGATVTDVFGDFVYLAGLGSLPTKSARVTGGQFDRNGRQGVAISRALDISIDHNQIDNVRRSTFDIEPATATWECRRITIEHNACGPRRLNFLSNVGAGAPVEDITVQDNTSASPITAVCYGTTTVRRARYKFLRNTATGVFGSPKHALDFVNIDGIEIAGNVQPFTPNRASGGAVKLTGCTAVIVWPDNQFPNAWKAATVNG